MARFGPERSTNEPDNPDERTQESNERTRVWQTNPGGQFAAGFERFARLVRGLTASAPFWPKAGQLVAVTARPNRRTILSALLTESAEIGYYS
jgi:hypothetical protein